MPLAPYRQMLEHIRPVTVAGRVRAVTGLTVRVSDFSAPVGAGCRICRGSSQVEARVTRVGSEPADGAIRVELAVERTPESIDLEHGLSGTVAVTVERVSPAQLVLRAVGKRIEEIR